MNDIVNPNTIFTAIAGLIIVALQTYNIVRDKNKAIDAQGDKLRSDIIKDYETRVQQIESRVAELTQENANLTGQLQSIRDLPLKQMAESITVIVKAQAVISDTQQQIIKP